MRCLHFFDEGHYSWTSSSSGTGGAGDEDGAPFDAEARFDVQNQPKPISA